MANPIADTEFKIKFNGQKLKVRVLDDGERINSRCIQTSVLEYSTAGLIERDRENEILMRNEILSSEWIIECLKKKTWFPCNCVGEKTDEKGHHHRIYLEVLSPFFKPISDDSSTDVEDKGEADL